VAVSVKTPALEDPEKAEVKSEVSNMTEVIEPVVVSIE
jgi:hypothetical protein